MFALMFEHPAEASSWSMKAMQQMKALDGIRIVKLDFCMLGMKTTDDNGKEAAARKRTKVMTNSNAVALLLQEAQCRSEHVHQHLLSNRAGPCQEYTDEFCQLICEEIKREKDTVKWKDHMREVFDITKPFAKLLSVHQKLEKLIEEAPRPQLMSLQHKLKEWVTPAEEVQMEGLYRGVTFIDDVTGTVLDKAKTIEARVK